jgi:hypothetical protein
LEDFHGRVPAEVPAKFNSGLLWIYSHLLPTGVEINCRNLIAVNKTAMKKRYRLYRRNQGGRYYIHDDVTGKQDSLHTTDRAVALRLFHSRNEAEQQPAVQPADLARAYLVSRRPGKAAPADVAARHGRNRQTAKLARPSTAGAPPSRDKAFNGCDPASWLILETQAATLFAGAGELVRVSTNVYLRRIHNFALDMYVAAVAGACRQDGSGRPSSSRRSAASRLAEHLAIVEREHNPERKAFYKLAWHLGASQSDLANLEAENIDWEHNVVSFARRKTGSIAIMRFDNEVAEILRDLPGSGPLFPYMRSVRSGDRATEFWQRCHGLGIKGVTLHSYRYAWAERAKKAGYPERFAQEALGHNSKAIHRAYARRAQVELPPLSEFERMRAKFAEMSKTIEPVMASV